MTGGGIYNFSISNLWILNIAEQMSSLVKAYTVHVNCPDEYQ